MTTEEIIEIGRTIRETDHYKNMTSYTACAIAEGFCEGEGATPEQQIAAWQWLIDTGQCWTLQGRYGRMAKELLDAGVCKLPAKNT
jgi:hypothetical protein